MSPLTSVCGACGQIFFVDEGHACGPRANCAHLHSAFGPGCPHCTPRPASKDDGQRTAWALAGRDTEHDVWLALYAALIPSPSGWQPQKARVA